MMQLSVHYIIQNWRKRRIDEKNWWRIDEKAKTRKWKNVFEIHHQYIFQNVDTILKNFD